MTTAADDCFFQDLTKEDPQEVCKRAVCAYDPEAGMYSLSVWGQEYAVYPHRSKVDAIGKAPPDKRYYMELFIVHYLLGAKETPLRNQWISEKDIPGGPTFFRGPHLIPTHLISDKFVNDTEMFKKNARSSAGSRWTWPMRRFVSTSRRASRWRFCTGPGMRIFPRKRRYCTINPLPNIWRLISSMH